MTFSDAAAEWLRYVGVDRQRKPSTLEGYRAIVRSQLLPAFGETPLEEITTPVIEQWLASLGGAASSRTKALVLLHGVLKRAKKVWGLSVNAADEVEKPPTTRSGEIQVYLAEEVWALVRAAANETDAALFLAAAFTGLRLGELLALCWRDVDFAGSIIRVRTSYSAKALTSPKSGKVRAVPMAPDVASVLAQLGRRQHWVGDDDLVFPGATGTYWTAPRSGSATRSRSGAPVSVRSAFTTYATRSARG